MYIEIPGNYPYECWHSKPQFGLRLANKVFVLLVDVNQFTELSTQLSPSELTTFITKFFISTEEAFGEIARKRKFWVNKYIGDAVFAIFTEPVVKAVVECTKYLLKGFHIETHQKLSAIADSVSCLKGGIGGDLYYDYSYWGQEINSLFKKSKEIEEGVVWITSRVEPYIGSLRQDFAKSGVFRGESMIGLSVDDT